MSRIFISYRREDSAGEAGRIYDHLERKFGREAIFKDVDVIAYGDNFRDRIHEAVGQCEILLAIIGRRWLQVQDTAGRRRLDNPADWVRLEIETALNRDVRVIPILLDGVGMPAIRDLPGSLQPLCYRNAARVRHDPDFRKDIERVLRVIEQNLDKIGNSDTQTSASSVNTELGVPPNFLKDSRSLFSPPDSQQLLNSTLANQDAKHFRGILADYEKAIDETIQSNSDDERTHYNRGVSKSALGDKQGAIAAFGKAIQIKPEYAAAYNNRGLAKEDLGDKQGAIADYDKAIQIEPKYAEAYFNCGFAKSALDDKQGAIIDFGKAIQIKPEYAGAYHNRGLAKENLGDQKGAIADYDKAIQIEPKYAEAYNNRGFAKSALGDQKGAIADYDKAIQLNYDDVHVSYNNRGVAKYKLGDKKGAIADYDKVIQIDPYYEAVYHSRGVAKYELGDQKGAITDYEKNIHLNPENATAYHNRGVAKYELGDKKGAISDYKKAMSLAQQQGNTYIYDLAQSGLKLIS